MEGQRRRRGDEVPEVPRGRHPAHHLRELEAGPPLRLRGGTPGADSTSRGIEVIASCLLAPMLLDAPSPPGPGGQYHDVAVFDDRMWVLEGYSGATATTSGTRGRVCWELPASTPWSPRHAASVFAFDDALWVVAGNNMQPDVWKLASPARARPFEPKAWRTAGPAVTLNGRSAPEGVYRGPIMLSLLAARGAEYFPRRRQALRLGLGGLDPPAAALHRPMPGPGRGAPEGEPRHLHLPCGGPSQLDLWDPKPDAPEASAAPSGRSRRTRRGSGSPNCPAARGTPTSSPSSAP